MKPAARTIRERALVVFAKRLSEYSDSRFFAQVADIKKQDLIKRQKFAGRGEIRRLGSGRFLH